LRALTTLALAAGCGDSSAPGPLQAGADPAVVSDAGGSTTPPAPAQDVPTPAPCASPGNWSSLVPGPGQASYDPALAAAVARFDRLHEAVSTKALGLSGTHAVVLDPGQRSKLAAFLDSKWNTGDDDPTDDLAQYGDLDAATFVTSWDMATGLYAGSDLAADAFRYAVLRDRGGDCTAVARARHMLAVGLDALHVVATIPGKAGSIARGIARKSLPGAGANAVVPLFDVGGQPLPAEKDNGTWRADNSGLYPDLIWVDSCSRDMLFGWTLAMASAWEVIASDPTIPAQSKNNLGADAKAVLDGLMKTRPSGKDLELWDPDGRRTLHGALHETALDTTYLIKNGPASLMALGEVAALVSVVGDAGAHSYLAALLGPRGLPAAVSQSLSITALAGDQSNHSGYNMLFLTAWLAQRYIDAPQRSTLKKPIEKDLYDPPLAADKPSQWKQSFYDFIVAASSGGAWVKGNAAPSFDAAAVARGLETLTQFPAAPYYDRDVVNCDDAEIAAGSCLLLDGVTTVKLGAGHGDSLVADKPLPITLRPTSNYYWRSNPHFVNGLGSGKSLYPGSDLRLAYWMGRYVRVGQ
jgi:hypothetical protein